MGHRSLLSIADLSGDDIRRILTTAQRFTELLGRDNKKVPTLRGRTVINLFFEASTRTSTSFELAAKRLSADVINIKGSGSSVEKGESLKDTILTLNAYGPDIFVIRHKGVGACHLASRFTDAAVLNAGDGKHEHPSQALLARRNAHRHRRRRGPLPCRPQRHHGDDRIGGQGHTRRSSDPDSVESRVARRVHQLRHP
jgi:aspartate carbamoyltransferase catalytic subunit